MAATWMNVVAVFCLVPGADEPTRYPRAELLMEAADLTKPEVAGKFRILDARGKASYDAGHIPAAVWVDITTWGRQFAKSRDTETWWKLIGNIGIEGRSQVVVYGDKLNETARLWWILRYWGIQDCRILNGGWKAWQSSGGKTSTDVPMIRTITPNLTPQGRRLELKSEILHSLRKQYPLQIIDARSTGEYCGDTKKAERNGAIPGAVHREWTDMVDAKTGRFKSPAELDRILKESRIDPTKPTVTYCQSGGRAAALAFALELMGFKDVRNYYRSWAEWGNDPNTPIVKPPKK